LLFIKNAFAFLSKKIEFVIFSQAFAFLVAVDLLCFWLFFLEKHAGFWRVFLLCIFLNLFKRF